MHPQEVPGTCRLRRRVLTPEDPENVMSVNWIEIIVFFCSSLWVVTCMLPFCDVCLGCDSDEDTSQFMLPVTLIIMFAFWQDFTV